MKLINLLKMFPYFIVLLGAVLRVMELPANFAPIAAIAMFGGAYLNKKLAIILPLAAMLVSDYFIGFDSLESRLGVYGSFIISSLLGMWLRNRKSVGTVIGASLLGSISFFLITNFVWLHNTSMYPHTFAGLIESYTNALPFFRNTILGDLFFVGVFFGSYELVKYYSENSKLQIPIPKQ